MTLTEQWKKGELQGGWYFLEFENGSNFPVYYCGFNREFEFGWDWKISKVLARCSYEEFDNITKCYLSAHERAEKLEKENQQLKELLNYIRDEIADMPACSYQWGFRWVHEAAYRIDKVLK